MRLDHLLSKEFSPCGGDEPLWLLFGPVRVCSVVAGVFLLRKFFMPVPVIGVGGVWLGGTRDQRLCLCLLWGVGCLACCWVLRRHLLVVGCFLGAVSRPGPSNALLLLWGVVVVVVGGGVVVC